jgi:NAD dependent epimerase/dehydratase family enzyme
MAMIVVNGSKVSSDKIRKTGFNFKYENLDEALDESLKLKA